jgi:hypothetical protein
MESPSISDSSDPCQQIREPVSRQNYPSVSNPTHANNVADRKHRNRFDIAAVPIFTFGNPNPPFVTVSNLRRNLETLFSPRLKAGVRKFGKLTPLKRLGNRSAVTSFAT